MPVGVPATHIRNPRGQFTRRGRGFSWEGLDTITRNINKRYHDLQRTRKQAANTLARKMQAYMKSNAKWSDVTGDAREGLKALAIHNDRAETSTVWLGHGVPYGFWLETRFGGKYAIIGPTLAHFQGLVGGEVREAESRENTLDRIYG